jgi:catalase (peroxidase I)
MDVTTRREKFVKEFAAWTKVMNLERYDFA